MVGSAASAFLFLALLVASVESGSKGSNGGYEQYYQQYVGGYSGTSKDKSSKSSQANGGYQQYYQQYMPSSAQGASKDSIGQQYVGGGTHDTASKAESIKSGADQKHIESVELDANVPSSSKEKSADNLDKTDQSSGSYQQYYQQYMPGGGGSYQQYYQQYVGAGSQGGSGKSAQASGYQQYYQKYIQEYKQQYGKCRESEKAMNVNHGQSSAQAGSGNSKSPEVASTFLLEGQEEVASCSTKQCVEDWREKSEANVKNCVPKEAQHFPLATVEKEYQKNLARIAAAKNAANATKGHAVPADVSELVVLPSMMVAEVGACSTRQCVEDWREKNEADVKKRVPKDYQHFRLASIEKEYQKNLARVAAAKNAASASAGHAVPADVSELVVLPSMMVAEVVACSTRQCVEDWRAKNEADVKKRVPKDYQHFRLASVEKEYKKNLARLEGTSATNATKQAEEHSKHVEAFLAAKLRPSKGPTFAVVALLSLVAGLYVVRCRLDQCPRSRVVATSGDDGCSLCAPLMH